MTETNSSKTLKTDIARVIVQEETIKQHVADLAARLSADYAEFKNDLVIVGILKGAFIFLSDLCRSMTIPHSVEFMSISSYGMQGDVSGAVRIVMDLRTVIEGKHVVIVEDIVDRGGTLRYLVKTLQSRQPASLRTCVLLTKEGVDPQINIDYLGFEIPDVWVVGYGLDYMERYRTLPYIAEFVIKD